MMLHERALKLPTLAKEEEQAASVLETAGMGDGPVGFHGQQTVERVLKALLAVRGVNFPRRVTLCGYFVRREPTGTKSP